MNKNIFSMLLLLVFSIGIGSYTQAAYLKDIPRIVVQPNGDTLHCFASGDEFYNYLHDVNHYTIVQNKHTGYYMYAQKENGEIVPSPFIANSVDPESVGLQPGIRISPESWMARRKSFENQMPAKNVSSLPTINHGHFNNLVVFIRFLGDTNLTTSYSAVENMYNDTTPQANSMYNYFKSTSYNQLFVTASFYPTPSGNNILSYEDIYPRSYYMPYSETNTNGYTDDNAALREHALLQRAVNYIASSVPTSLNIDYDNDGYVDNVCFVAKGDLGDWSGILWPHRWVLSTQDLYINAKKVFDYNFMLEGSTEYFSNDVLCHEMQHTLSYPDFYHYYEYELEPIGEWDLMAITNNPPQHSGAYAKYKWGHWIDSIPLITTPGTYTLYPIGTSAIGNAYKIQGELPGQYFVLEYRDTTYFYESELPGSGLVIYRINDAYEGNMSYNGNSQFDELYIFRPNGTVTENGTLSEAFFSSESGRTSFNASSNPRPFFTDGSYSSLSITNISSAGSTISFTYNGIDPTIVAAVSSVGLSGYLPLGPASQAVEIIGCSLTDSITISITSPFQISTDNNTWVSSLKLSPIGATLYVNYSSLVLGSHTGTISLTSSSALPVSISLTGTICEVISAFPYTDGFENGMLASCWKQEYVKGKVNWLFQNGGEGSPDLDNPHSGSYNVAFSHASFYRYKSRLIIPELNISELENPTLTFWRAQPSWGGDIDYLKVYYKTSDTAEWVLLNSYTTDITSWTLTTIDLPNPSATYFIAFEGTSNCGYGVFMDDISIDSAFVDPENINELEIAKNIQLFPNPVQSTLFIRNLSQQENQVIQIQLFDITGRLLSVNSLTNNSLEIDFSSYSQGLYLIKFLTVEGAFTKKILKY